MSTVEQMTREHLALEALELEDRVRDLEADNRVLRELISVGLEALHQAQERERRLRDVVRQQYEVIRMLRSDHIESSNRRAA